MFYYLICWDAEVCCWEFYQKYVDYFEVFACYSLELKLKDIFLISFQEVLQFIYEENIDIEQYPY